MVGLNGVLLLVARLIPKKSIEGNNRFVSAVLLFAVMACLCYLLLLASLNHTDYQDSWILGGLVMPFFLFVAVSCIALCVIDDLVVLTLVAMMLSVALNIIPGVKYQLFSAASDSLAHYNIVRSIMASGSISPAVSKEATNAAEYAGAPGMQFTIAAFSLILGISANDGMKFAMPLVYSAFPPLAYFISKKLIASKEVMKFVIISASLPSFTAYSISGTVFGRLFLLCALMLPIVIAAVPEESQSAYALLNMLLLIGLLISHTLTPPFFILSAVILLVALYVLNRYLWNGASLVASTIHNIIFSLMFFGMIIFAWWLYQATSLFDIIIGNIQQITGGQTIAVVPARFYELNVLSKIQVFLVYYAQDFVFTVLTGLGILVFLIRRKIEFRERFFYTCLVILLIFLGFLLSVELETGYGNFEASRLFAYAWLFSPFLVGLALYASKLILHRAFHRRLVVRLLTGAMLFAIISLSVIQFYPYQPVVPKNYAMGLTNGDYVVYAHQINTSYQEFMISFASNHCEPFARVGSDALSELQAASFSSGRLDYHNAGSLRCVLLYHAEIKNSKWNLFLLHDNRSGPSLDPITSRTNYTLESAENDPGINLVYDNGASFVLQK